MVLGAITGVPTPACLSAASNPVEAVTPPFGAGTNIAWALQRTTPSIRRSEACLRECQDDSAKGDERCSANLQGRQLLS